MWTLDHLKKLYGEDADLEKMKRDLDTAYELMEREIEAAIHMVDRTNYIGLIIQVNSNRILIRDRANGITAISVDNIDWLSAD